MWSIPGSFLVRKEALVMASLATAGLDWAGESAILMPMGPSWGWPDGLKRNELTMALVTCAHTHINMGNTQYSNQSVCVAMEMVSITCSSS